METTEYALNRQYRYNGTVYPSTEEEREVPVQLAERDRQLDEDKGVEKDPPSPVDISDGLPGAIPETSRSILEEQGIDTWEKLLQVEDYAELENIGSTRAENIEAAVDQVQNFHE